MLANALKKSSNRCGYKISRFALLLGVIFAFSIFPFDADAATTISKSLSRPVNNLGLVGWWTFDGPDISGMNALDRSGNGKTGAIWHITATSSITIAASTDDAENCADGFMGTTSSDLELTEDSGCTGVDKKQLIGLRFLSVPIPKNASTTLASIQFTTDDDETGNGQTDLIIEAENVDDATTFTSTANNIRNRATTTARVLWSSVPAWNTFAESGASQLSPDFSGVMQAIVNRSGWSSGNDMNIIISGSGFRPAESYDNFSARAAVLNLRWNVPGVIPGRVGQALQFDGTDDYIDVGNVSDSVQSVAFWLKVATSTTAQNILDLNGTATITLSSGTLSANNFTSPTIYVDGAVSSTVNDTNWHYVSVTTGTAINASAAFIGRVSNGYFGGNFDDVRLYNRTLSAAEVLRLYQIGATSKIAKTLPGRDSLTSGLVGWWTFDGPDMLTNVADKSGQGNNGSLSHGGSGTTTAPGPIGQALSFDGTDDYVNLSETSGLPVFGATGYSVGFWVKGAAPTGTNMVVYGEGNGSSDNQVLRLQSGTSGSGFLVFIRDNSAVVQLNKFSTGAVFDNKWHHIVWTDLNGAGKLYIDGAQDSADFSYTPSTYTITKSSIGALDRASVSNYFNGSVDDVRVYNRVLSAAEVLQLYNLGR